MATYKDLNYLKPQVGDVITDASAVMQAIYTRFSTKRGSRIFRPSFGGDLSRYLFEPCDELTARSMYYDVLQELKDEPRISVNTSKTNVIPDPANNRMIIQIVFSIIGVVGDERTITLTFDQKG